jgi:hypothetical protein
MYIFKYTFEINVWIDIKKCNRILELKVFFVPLDFYITRMSVQGSEFPEFRNVFFKVISSILSKLR